MSKSQLFSEELNKWLAGKQAKSISSLQSVFQEKSYALILIFLLLPSATPFPTGGITNVFEIIAFIVCFQLIIGGGEIWLPKRWQSISISGFAKDKALPIFIKYLKRAEKISSHKLDAPLKRGYFRSILGVFAFVFTLGAFVAPPFSGLDTLPSIGVVLLGLAIIVEDHKILIAALISGSIGVFTNGLIVTEIVDRFF